MHILVALKLISMWDTIKDYMNSFIALIIILIPLIKEAKKGGKGSKGYITFLSACCLALFFLGKDKIDRDNKKEAINNKRNFDDSVKLSHLDSSFNSISISYKRDTTKFNDFLKKLEKDMHIKDSAGIPIPNKINNYINKVDYLKQF